MKETPATDTMFIVMTDGTTVRGELMLEESWAAPMEGYYLTHTDVQIGSVYKPLLYNSEMGEPSKNRDCFVPFSQVRYLMR